MKLIDIAENYSQYVIDFRRYFHQYPEPSTQEFNTSKKIKEELDRIGVEWEKCGLETGVKATIKGSKPGKTIMLRGDMDALSIKEETGLDFASKNEGFMHACGHDCHTAMLLSAVNIINDMKQELAGTVVFAFQPAEEIGAGAKAMIDDGILKDVDACFGIHVWGDIPSGKFSCSSGPRMAAARRFAIDIKGKGGHGAEPHKCIDAAMVAFELSNSLQTIVSRYLPPVEPAVISIGTIEVGSRWNVIAEYAHIEGTTRCYSHEWHEKIPILMDRIALGTAKMFGAEIKTVYNMDILPTINDKNVSIIASNSAEKILGTESCLKIPPTAGGEDFSSFSTEIPGAMMLLGIKNEECNAIYGNHNSKFTVDESVLIKGAMIYAQVAFDFNSH